MDIVALMESAVQATWLDQERADLALLPLTRHRLTRLEHLQALNEDQLRNMSLSPEVVSVALLLVQYAEALEKYNQENGLPSPFAYQELSAPQPEPEDPYNNLTNTFDNNHSSNNWNQSSEPHEPGPQQQQPGPEPLSASDEWGSPFPSFATPPTQRLLRNSSDSDPSHSPSTPSKANPSAQLPSYPSTPSSGSESPSTQRAKPALPPKSTRALDQVNSTRKLSTGSRLSEMLSELGGAQEGEGAQSFDFDALVTPVYDPTQDDPSAPSAIVTTVKAPPRRLGDPSVDPSHSASPNPYSTARPASGRTSTARPPPPSQPPPSTAHQPSSSGGSPEPHQPSPLRSSSGDPLQRAANSPATGRISVSRTSAQDGQLSGPRLSASRSSNNVNDSQQSQGQPGQAQASLQAQGSHLAASPGPRLSASRGSGSNPGNLTDRPTSSIPPHSPSVQITGSRNGSARGSANTDPLAPSGTPPAVANLANVLSGTLRMRSPLHQSDPSSNSTSTSIATSEYHSSGGDPLGSATLRTHSPSRGALPDFGAPLPTSTTPPASSTPPQPFLNPNPQPNPHSNNPSIVYLSSMPALPPQPQSQPSPQLFAERGRAPSFNTRPLATPPTSASIVPPLSFGSSPAQGQAQSPSLNPPNVTVSLVGSSEPSVPAPTAEQAQATLAFIETNDTRGRFTGTAKNTSGNSHGAMLSMDKLDFAAGGLKVKFLMMTPITASNSKKNHSYFEMLVTCGPVQWHQVRTDAQFTALHEKVVGKLQTLSRDISFPLNTKQIQKALKDKGKLTTTSVLKKSKSTSKGSDAHEEGDDEAIDSQKLLLDMQKYVDEICEIPELLRIEKFRDFLDPSEESSSWLMGRISTMRGTFAVNNSPDCYCALYGGQIYVFKDMASDSAMYRIDLLCAKVDLVASPFQSGGGAFMVKEDDGSKATYTFASRVAAYAEEWALACRKARRDEAISTADLLTYAKSIHGRPAPMNRDNSKRLSTDLNKVAEANAQKVLLSPRRATLAMEMPKYEPDSEQNVVKGAAGAFIGGSTDKILDKVIEGVLDRIAFLRCFPMFIDPEELLKKLCARFLYPTADPKHRTQVVDFLFKWQQTIPQDFLSDEMQNALVGFVSLGQGIPNLSPDIVPRLTAIAKAAKIVNVPIANTAQVADPIVPKLFGQDKFDVFDLSPIEIARQSTLVAATLWKKVSLREFLYWNSKQQESKSANILSVVNHFNFQSAFFSTFVMTGCTPKQRGFYLRHVVDVLRAAIDMHNFHLVFAILAAFESAPVSRLKKSWAHLDPPREQFLAHCKEQFSALGNFNKYREILIASPQPVLPYVGVFLKDITFIDDGNKTRFEGTNLVNWNKCVVLSSTIAQVVQYQQCRYALNTVTEIRHFMSDYKVINDKDQWALSLTVEPREKT